MGYKDLTPEQREMAKNCNTPEELLDLSRKIGYDLSDEELDALNGGARTAWSCSTDEACSCYYPCVCASGSTRPSEASPVVGFE